VAVVSYEAMDDDNYSREALLTTTQRQLARIELLLAAWPEGEERPAPKRRSRTALRPGSEEHLPEDV